MISTEQCFTEDKYVDVGWEKERPLFFPPPVGLIYGFQMVIGMFIGNLPSMPEPLGRQTSGCKFHENRTFFQDFAGSEGWGD